jgi:hypothetical protein
MRVPIVSVTRLHLASFWFFPAAGECAVGESAIREKVERLKPRAGQQLRSL